MRHEAGQGVTDAIAENPEARLLAMSTSRAPRGRMSMAAPAPRPIIVLAYTCQLSGMPTPPRS